MGGVRRGGPEKECLDGICEALTASQWAAIEGTCHPNVGVLPPGDPAAIRDAAQKTVFDRVHIVRYVTKVVDKNRRQEHRALEKTDRESSFTGTKRLRLNAAETLPLRQRQEFKQSKPWTSRLAVPGHSEHPPGTADIPRSRVGGATLPALVPIGDSLPPPTDPQGRPHVEAALG